MDILGGGLVGRPAEEIGKLFDVADILGLSLGAEPAYRTDGLVGHWGLLSWVRFKAPQSQDRTPASATPRDPSLATNYRESGFVLRRRAAGAPGAEKRRVLPPEPSFGATRASVGSARKRAFDERLAPNRSSIRTELARIVGCKPPS